MDGWRAGRVSKKIESEFCQEDIWQEVGPGTRAPIWENWGSEEMWMAAMGRIWETMKIKAKCGVVLDKEKGLRFVCV